MESALSTAEKATNWLSTGGGWAMFIVAGVVIYFLVRHILALNSKLDVKDAAFLVEIATFRKDLQDKDAAHKTESASVVRDYQQRLEEKEDKIFGLLDKTNELLAAMQAIKPR